MADLQQVLQIVFQGVDETTDTVKRVSENLDQLSLSVTEIADPFADLANLVLKIDSVLAAMAVTLGGVAVKEAAKFESSLLDLQKQLEDGEGQATEYAAELEKLALKYGVNANELVSSAADFKAAGFTIETSIQLVKQSLDLLIAGGVSAETATNILKNSLAGFQVPANQTAESAQRIADVLNKVADISQGSFSDLAQGFSDLAPIAKLTGLSFEEAAAALSVVIDKGYAGSEAANALKSTFLSLIDPTKEAREAMAALGVQFNGAGIPIGNIKEILTTLIPRWDQLSDSQKLNTASIIAGKEQAGKFIALLDDWQLAMERTKVANQQAGGSIEKEVTLRLQSADAQFKSLAEAVRQFSEALGKEFLGSTKGVAGGLSELAQSFKTIIEGGALDPLLNLVTNQGEQLGALLRDIARNLPAAFQQVDFSGLVDAFGGLGDELKRFFAALFGEIDLTTVEGLASALQSVIDTVESLVRTTQGIVRAFEPFAAAIRETVQNFNQLDESSKVDFGEVIGSMKAVIDYGTIVAGTLLAIGKAGLDMATVIDAAFGVVKVGINALQVAFDVMTAAIVAPFAGIAKALLLVSDAAGTTNSEFAGQLQDIVTYFDAVVENADRNSRELQSGWNQAIGQSSEELQNLKIQLQESENGLKNFGKAAADSGDSARQSVKDYDGILAKLNEIKSGAGDASVSLAELKNISEKKLIVSGDFSFNDEPIKQLKKTWDENGNPVFSAIDNASIKATGAFAAVGDSASKSADKIAKTTKKTDEFRIKMEEIASNERIKTIEAAVSLNIAQLEADTERAKALLSSIDTTISSTGDLIGTLFGQLGNTASSFDKLGIEQQIDLENKRRQEALDIQKKLAEAEIARIDAQTSALARGDALIRVDGTGLAPQLEAFMWEILKAIRVRANAEFADYLLGVA